MNNELEILAREIADLQKKITIQKESVNEQGSSKKKLAFEIREETDRLLREYQAAVNALEKQRQAAEELFQKLQSEYLSMQRELDEKNRLYAKLLESQADMERIEALTKTLDEICADFPAFFKAHLYQHEDILFTINAFVNEKNGILNANDLGLGKTFESTVAIYILSALLQKELGRKPRILWLTKKSLVDSTPREIKKWWPECKVSSTYKANTPQERKFLLEFHLMAGDVLVANYEFVRTTATAREITWDLVVIDEVHKLKGGANSSGPTAIWEACKEVCQKARFTLMLSGTPMVNKPQEMWSYLHIFNPEKFPTLRQFETHFMEYKTIAGEYQLAVNPEKILQGALKGQMIRRRRDEVGLQLPELTREYITLVRNPKQDEVYQKMRTDFFIWLDENQDQALTATAIIAQLTRLRQINVWPAGIKFENLVTGKKISLDVEDSSKIDECMDLIENAQDQVVVFSTFNEPLNEVRRRCEKMGLKCAVINGENVKMMGEYEKAFQQKEIDVLAINSAMGEGLNLQKNPDSWPGGASVAIFLDLWWSPARNEQCEGRIHRQGANQPVTIYILFNERSIDYFIQDKLDRKSAQFSSIMESDEIRPASEWRKYLEEMI